MKKGFITAYITAIAQTLPCLLGLSFLPLGEPFPASWGSLSCLLVSRVAGAAAAVTFRHATSKMITNCRCAAPAPRAYASHVCVCVCVCLCL